MISRILEQPILKKMKPGRVLCLMGARRTGKTVLMERIRALLPGGSVLMVQGDNLEVSEILASRRVEALHSLAGKHRYLFIDEAQQVPGIGHSLKLLADTRPGLSLFITGSSAFDLRGKIGEPLVGRAVYLRLHPLAQLELKSAEDYLQTKQHLERRLLYGSYPQVVTAESDHDRREELRRLRDGYLLRDILALDNLKDSLFVFNLLRLLAFQIGNDVSIAELGSSLGVHAKTVRRYLELLEKTYVLFSLHGFSRNLRKEIAKSPRYYFWDNGIRNSVIANFNPLHLRDDVGRLWENYCISERLKKADYAGWDVRHYFWRTYDQKEIDLVEERGGKLQGYEIKWQAGRAKKPGDFLAAYPNSTFRAVGRENYLEFIA